MDIIDVKQMEKILEEEPSNLYVKRKEYYRQLYNKFVEEALILSQLQSQYGKDYLDLKFSYDFKKALRGSIVFQRSK